MKKYILIIFVFISFISCKNESVNDKNIKNSTNSFNDDLSKPFDKRLVNYVDYYCKTNLKTLSGRKLTTTTSDILKFPAESENKGEEFYVFTYNSHTDDLKYILDGEVIIRFLNNEFSLKKEYLHNNDDYITVENSAYMISEAGGGRKISFSKKY
jgi:hypothetical protein